jgi:hypothetical protein
MAKQLYGVDKVEAWLDVFTPFNPSDSFIVDSQIAGASRVTLPAWSEAKTVAFLQTTGKVVGQHKSLPGYRCGSVMWQKALRPCSRIEARPKPALILRFRLRSPPNGNFRATVRIDPQKHASGQLAEKSATRHATTVDANAFNGCSYGRDIQAECRRVSGLLRS